MLQWRNVMTTGCLAQWKSRPGLLQVPTLHQLSYMVSYDSWESGTISCCSMLLYSCSLKTDNAASPHSPQPPVRQHLREQLSGAGPAHMFAACIRSRNEQCKSAKT